jgi:hypothetical protein
LVAKERKEGNLAFAGYQGCSGYDGCGIVVIYSVVNCKTEGVRRDSVVLYYMIILTYSMEMSPSLETSRR